MELYVVELEVYPGTTQDYLFKGGQLSEQRMFHNVLHMVVDHNYYKYKPDERVALGIKRIKILKTEGWNTTLINLLNQTSVRPFNSLTEIPDQIITNHPINKNFAKNPTPNPEYNLLSKYNINK